MLFVVSVVVLDFDSEAAGVVEEAGLGLVDWDVEGCCCGGGVSSLSFLKLSFLAMLFMKRLSSAA